MAIKAGYSTPMFHVAEIERSIRFYELLGLQVIDTDRCTAIGWARLHCEGGAVMFLRAEEPVGLSPQAVPLYMYTPDLVPFREHLLANGISVPPIKHPGYMPSGEICIADPDGYVIFVGHWGKAEQEAWEKRIGRKG
jgi:catechol 2,3-dioxygenase-like lactoylglutathione lyase family enzyme